MEITFLIGNGFDLNLGMKTSYYDFFTHMQNQSTTPNMIYTEIFKDEINDYTTWADLEIKLGDYSKKLEPNSYKAFLDNFYELKTDFSNYLASEIKKCNKIFSNEYAKQFSNGLINFQDKMKITSKKKLDLKFNENFYYNIITFNYTNVIDYYFEQLKGQHISSYNYEATNYYEYLKDLLHIHGYIDKNMLMGVNDKSQFYNSEILACGVEYESAFIKPISNAQLGEEANEIGETMISVSDIICVFGMSLGDSDKKWWEHIGTTLLKDEMKKLVIFHYDNSIKNLINPSILIRKEHDLKEKFLNKTSLDEEEKDIIKDRIFIEVNKSVFQFTEVESELLEPIAV